MYCSTTRFSYIFILFYCDILLSFYNKFSVNDPLLNPFHGRSALGLGYVIREDYILVLLLPMHK